MKINLSELKEKANKCAEVNWISNQITLQTNEVLKLIQSLELAKKTLQRIKSPDHAGIDGMIIADMGLKHFTEYSAERSLTQLSELVTWGDE